MSRKPRARTVSKDGPDPVDVHVGARVRERRVMQGMSQQVLGERVNLTFQQIQKYERGFNRISASVLWRIAEALDVPVSFFFDGFAEGKTRASDDLGRSELTLIRHFRAAPVDVQPIVLGLLRDLGKGVVDEDDPRSEEVAEVDMENEVKVDRGGYVTHIGGKRIV
jgi:transcriptional regulator with XRE-family HTH domain